MKYNGMDCFHGRTKAPCRDCPKHSETCHATCEAYKEFERIHAEERKTINSNKHKYYLGFGARWRSEKELEQEQIARRHRKKKQFK